MNPILCLAAALPFVAAAAPSSIDAMRHERRILVVAAPTPGDPALAEQRRLLAQWRAGAAERDVTVVELVGDHVTGVSDPAAMLRRRYGLPIGRFAVLLVGKDGHVAYRSARPVPAATLEATIDAMPMRRAGRR